jgi:hypothetical protein
MTMGQKPQKLSSTAKRVQAELASLADDKGLVCISMPTLAAQIGISECATNIARYELIKAGVIVVARASYQDGRRTRPKTYCVIPSDEILARQAPNVIPFVRKAKSPDRPLLRFHLKGT